MCSVLHSSLAEFLHVEDTDAQLIKCHHLSSDSNSVEEILSCIYQTSVPQLHQGTEPSLGFLVLILVRWGEDMELAWRWEPLGM